MTAAPAGSALLEVGLFLSGCALGCVLVGLVLLARGVRRRSWVAVTAGLRWVATATTVGVVSIALRAPVILGG